MTTVLIQGAGVAGLALAYWVRRHGMTPVLVEAAPGPRPGGQAVDVRGPAVDVVTRMGLAGELRAARLEQRGMTVVDPDGTELLSTTERTLTGGELGGRDVEILRDDLCGLLGAAAAGVECLWGDQAVALEDGDDGVRATFRHAPPRTVDLVVGADGEHSAMRALAFGEPGLVPFDSHVAVFGLPNDRGLDRWQVICQAPETLAVVYTGRTNAELRAMLGFRAAGLVYDRRDRAAQRALVAEAFAGQGWWVPDLLAAMEHAGDFWFSSMTQVRTPCWHAGRVALLGDAAWCTTPLSGQGTSLALVGAEILAAELARRAGHEQAFAAYERRMRPDVERDQAAALENDARSREAPAHT